MKKLNALILALLMVFSLVACSSSTPEESKTPAAESYKILYIPSWAASEYFQNSYAVWKEQCAAIGWEMEMQGPKEYTPDSQLGVLEAALISQEYDAIVLYPIAAEAFAVVKDELWDTYHTPIIVWGMAESSNAGQYYMMNADRYLLTGDYIADMVIDYVDANMDYFSKYDGKIPYVAFGQANNPLQNARVLRAMELLDADGRFEMVEHYENVSDEKTTEYAESMLLNHPEVEIIVSYNDVLAIYIDNVLKETAVEISEHLRIFGVDGTNAARAAMLSGDSYIQGTAMSNHTFMGEMIIYTVQNAVPAAKEGKILDEINVRNVETFVNGEHTVKVTVENVKDYPVS